MSKANILELNNDCLIKIFENLTTIGMIAVRETCKGFQAAIEYSFSRRYKTKHCLSIDFHQIIKANVQTKQSIKDLNKLFRYFGPFIKDLTIDGNFYRKGCLFTDILNAIDKNHCPNLKALKFRNIEFNSASGRSMYPFRSLFTGLEKLSIICCNGNEYILEQCILHCKNLKELKLRYLNRFDGRFLNCIQSKLEVFEMRHSRNFTAINVMNFFRRFPALKCIKIILCYFKLQDFCTMISQHLSTVESLHFEEDIFEEDFDDQRELYGLHTVEEIQQKLFRQLGVKDLLLPYSLELFNELHALDTSHIESLGVSFFFLFPYKELIRTWPEKLGGLINLKCLKIRFLPIDVGCHLPEKLCHLQRIEFSNCCDLVADDIMYLVKTLKRLTSVILHNTDIEINQPTDEMDFIEIAKMHNTKNLGVPLTIEMAEVNRNKILNAISSKSKREIFSSLKLKSFNSDH